MVNTTDPLRLELPISSGLTFPTRLTCPRGCGCPLASPHQGPYSQLPCGLGDGMEVFAGRLQPSSLWTWPPGEASLTEQLLSVPSKRQIGEGEATRQCTGQQDRKLRSCQGTVGSQAVLPCHRLLPAAHSLCSCPCPWPCTVQHRTASRIGRSRISLSLMWDLGSHQSPAEASRRL